MSHPKVTHKTTVAPERTPDVEKKYKSAVPDSSGSTFSAEGTDKFKKYKAGIVADDPTLSVLAEQGYQLSETQEALDENPLALSEPLDFIQKLRVQFSMNSRAKLKDFTRLLPVVPPYRELAPSVNSFNDDPEQKKAVLRDVIINYKKKLNTLRCMEKELEKQIAKGGVTVSEMSIEMRYKAILKRSINFCIQQYEHAVRLYRDIRNT